MEYKTIEAGGKSYRLAFTTNALCQLEDKVDGVTLANMAVQKVNNFLRYMFWAALISYRPKTTLADAGNIADAYMREHGGRDAALLLIREVQVLSGVIGEEDSDDEGKNGDAPQEA